MASAEPIHIGAGDSASQGYRFDLLQDVADQIRHMRTSGAHVSLSGRWLYLQDLIHTALHLPMKNYRMNIQETLSKLLPHLRWRRGALQPPQSQRDGLDRNTRVHVPDDGLRCVSWNTRGLIRSVCTSQISRELKLNYFKRLIENNNVVICLQEVYGKDEFLQATQVWAPRFSLFGTVFTRQRECRRICHRLSQGPSV